MKISRKGLARIEDRIKTICEKLTTCLEAAKIRPMNAEQRENFRDLQEELRVAQRQYRAFSDPLSGT